IRDKLVTGVQTCALPISQGAGEALDRQRLARALRESEERYRLIAEHINDAIVLTDLEGRLVFANGRAEVITGYTAQELTGLLVLDRNRRGAARAASRASR